MFTRLFLVAALALGRCGAAADPAPAPACDAGTERICAADACRCGASCVRTAQCAPSEVCAAFQERPAEGACVDAAWAGDVDEPTLPEGGSCAPPCEAAARCFAVGRVPTCLEPCRSDGDCPGACCVTARTGERVCPPDASLCPASDPCAACPSGTRCGTDGSGDQTCVPDGGCLNPGGAATAGDCAADVQCCSNYCKRGSCQPHRKRGDPCEPMVDFCEEAECLPPGRCECLADGEPCEGPAGACCSAYCAGGRCRPDGVRPRGTPCAENRWCIDALCVNGRCGGRVDQACGVHEDLCLNGPCCSGVCVGQLCSCVEAGGGCSTDRNCCGLRCVAGRCE